MYQVIGKLEQQNAIKEERLATNELEKGVKIQKRVTSVKLEKTTQSLKTPVKQMTVTKKMANGHAGNFPLNTRKNVKMQVKVKQ